MDSYTGCYSSGRRHRRDCDTTDDHVAILITPSFQKIPAKPFQLENQSSATLRESRRLLSKLGRGGSRQLCRDGANCKFQLFLSFGIAIQNANAERPKKIDDLIANDS